MLPPEAKSPKYKTQMCRNWEDTGCCRYGLKCQYAHGHHEKRIPAVHPMHKTRMCRHWENKGWCPFWGRCRFAHGPHDQRPIGGGSGAGGHDDGTATTSDDKTATTSDDGTATTSDDGCAHRRELAKRLERERDPWEEFAKRQRDLEREWAASLDGAPLRMPWSPIWTLPQL